MTDKAQVIINIDEELLLLKKKHGPLLDISIKKLEKNLVFKKPDRNILSMVMRMREDDPMEANRLFALNCLVLGDSSLLDDPDVLLSITPHLDSLVEIYDLEIKNL